MCSIYIPTHGRQSHRNRANEEMKHTLTHTTTETRKEKCSYKMFTSLNWCRCCCCCCCILLLFLFVDDSQHVPRLFVDLLFFTCSSLLNETFLFHRCTSCSLFTIFGNNSFRFSFSFSTHLSSIARKITSNVNRWAPFHTANNINNLFMFSQFFFSVVF